MPAELHGIQYLFVGLSAIGAGMVNALSGGGTLITFPTLLAVGVPSVLANVTSTVALCPGYLGATFAQAKELSGQRRRIIPLIIAGFFGGLAGGLLLLYSTEKAFRSLVPWLILFASIMLALQDPVRKWLSKHPSSPDAPSSLEKAAFMPIFFAAIYGGYFGAGLSVIVLAALGVMLPDSLTRLNAIKQLISFSANIAAALLFVCSGKVMWSAALVMAAGALLGGIVGGKLAGKIKPSTLRWIVVTVGVTVAVVYFVK